MSGTRKVKVSMDEVSVQLPEEELKVKEEAVERNDAKEVSVSNVQHLVIENNSIELDEITQRTESITLQNSESGLERSKELELFELTMSQGFDPAKVNLPPPSPVENRKFYVPVVMMLTAVKGKECMALLDSGSGEDLVLSKFIEGKIDSLPQDACLCDVIVAFGASRQVTKRVLPEFSINGTYFSRWFMVVPGFTKDMVLGLDFVGEHEDLISFKKRSFAGVSKENPIGLVDSDEFVEAVGNAAEVGFFTLKTEEKVDKMPMDAGNRFPDLIKEYKDVFLQELKETPVSRGKWDHRINVIPYVTVPSGKQLPLARPEFEELKSQVRKMLDDGLIRQLGVGESDFNSPVLFVRKKHGSYRMCVDYRLLHMTVVQKQFGMPVVEQLIKEVSGYRYYSTLDMTQSFHQIRLDDETSHVTAFSAFGKKFAYNVLPFGFTNAPAILQETVSQLIQEIPGCVNYIDDIIVYSNTIEEHRKSLLLLFEAFRKNKFFFKGSKCELGVSKVTF